MPVAVLLELVALQVIQRQALELRVALREVPV